MEGCEQGRGACLAAGAAQQSALGARRTTGSCTACTAQRSIHLNSSTSMPSSWEGFKGSGRSHWAEVNSLMACRGGAERGGAGQGGAGQRVLVQL